MRLLIATPNKFSYSETFVRNHIEYLKPVITVNDGWYPMTVSDGTKIFPKLLNISFIRILIKNALPSIYHKLFTFYFSKCLLKNKIDSIMVEYGPMAVSVNDACKNLNIPLAVHFHGFDVFEKKTRKKFLKKYLAIFENAKILIAVSNDMRDELIKQGADPKKTFFIPCGVNANMFHGANPLNAPMTFISVGRFTGKKAPHLTIRAFDIVLKKLPEAKLVMIGDGELFDESKQLAKDLNIESSIDFKGVMKPDKIADELRKAKVYVQHSMFAPNGDSEGLPGTVLEGSLSELPVVSTKHAGIKDAVQNGITGYLVEEGDYVKMAEYMIKLALDSNEAELMGKKGREYVLNNFTIEITTGKIKKLIEQELNK